MIGIKKIKNEPIHFLNKGKRSTSCIRCIRNFNNNHFFNNKLKKNDTQKNTKRQSTLVFCYDANEENSFNNNYIQQKSSNKEIYKKMKKQKKYWNIKEIIQLGLSNLWEKI